MKRLLKRLLLSVLGVYVVTSGVASADSSTSLITATETGTNWSQITNWTQVWPVQTNLVITNPFGIGTVLSPLNQFQTPSGSVSYIPLPTTTFVDFTGFVRQTEPFVSKFIVRIGPGSRGRGCRVGGQFPTDPVALQTTVGIGIGDPQGGSVDFVNYTESTAKPGWLNANFTYNHNSGGPAVSINVAMMNVNNLIGVPCLYDVLIQVIQPPAAPVAVLADAPSAPKVAAAPAAAPAAMARPQLKVGEKINLIKIGPKAKK